MADRVGLSRTRMQAYRQEIIDKKKYQEEYPEYTTDTSGFQLFAYQFFSLFSQNTRQDAADSGFANFGTSNSAGSFSKSGGQSGLAANFGSVNSVPLVGDAIGAIFGSEDSKQLPIWGPRYTEYKVLNSKYGIPIPEGYGNVRLAGNLIWNSPIVEELLDVEVATTCENLDLENINILGEEVYDGLAVNPVAGNVAERLIDIDRRYRYKTSLAYAFANVFTYDAEVVRIWINGEIAFDIREKNINAPAQLVSTNIRKYRQHDHYKDVNITAIYNGRQTEPDPDIKVYNPDTPAYHGTCYIVISDLDLAQWGYTIPKVEAEIYFGGEKKLLSAGFKNIEPTIDSGVGRFTHDTTDEYTIPDRENPWYYEVDVYERDLYKSPRLKFTNLMGQYANVQGIYSPGEDFGLNNMGFKDKYGYYVFNYNTSFSGRDILLFANTCGANYIIGFKDCRAAGTFPNVNQLLYFYSPLKSLGELDTLVYGESGLFGSAAWKTQQYKRDYIPGTTQYLIKLESEYLTLYQYDSIITGGLWGPHVAGEHINNQHPIHLLGYHNFAGGINTLGECQNIWITGDNADLTRVCGLGSFGTTGPTHIYTRNGTSDYAVPDSLSTIAYIYDDYNDVHVIHWAKDVYGNRASRFSLNTEVFGGDSNDGLFYLQDTFTEDLFTSQTDGTGSKSNIDQMPQRHRLGSIYNDGGITRSVGFYNIDTLTFPEDSYIGEVQIAGEPPHPGTVINSGSMYIPAVHGVIYRTIGSGGPYMALCRKVSKTFTLEEVVKDMCTVHLDQINSSDVDASTLAVDTVRGFFETERWTTRGYIDPLRKSYLFDAYESDGKLVFKKRGVETEVTDLSNDILITDGLQVNRKSEQELPMEAEIVYADVDMEYLQSTQRSRHIQTRSVNFMQNSAPIVFNADEAATSIKIGHLATFNETRYYTSNITYKYSYLTPGDLISFDSDNILRVTSTELDPNGTLSINANKEDSTIYNLNFDGYKRELESPKRSISKLYPFVFESANSISDGNYVYVTGLRRFSEESISVTAYNSYTGTTQYAGTVDMSKNIFRVHSNSNLNQLHPTHYGTWDRDAYLIVTILQGNTPQSISYAKAYKGYNRLILDGEIIVYKDAELVSGNTYKLSNLLRARFSTDDRYFKHELSSYAFEMYDSMPRILIEDYADDITLTFTLSDTISTSKVAHLIKNIGTLPLPPARLDYTKSTNDIVIDFVERHRIFNKLSSGVENNADEISGYKLDICDKLGNLIRTIESANNDIVYTEAMQISDFGSTIDRVYVKGYLKNIYGYTLKPLEQHILIDKSLFFTDFTTETEDALPTYITESGSGGFMKVSDNKLVLNTIGLDTVSTSKYTFNNITNLSNFYIKTKFRVNRYYNSSGSLFDLIYRDGNKLSFTLTSVSDNKYIDVKSGFLTETLSTSISEDVWYNIKILVHDNVVKVKLWTRDEPDYWLFEYETLQELYIYQHYKYGDISIEPNNKNTIVEFDRLYINEYIESTA